MKTYFQRSNGEKVGLGATNTFDEAFSLIDSDLKARVTNPRFVHRYTRVWPEDSTTLKIDVGSWSEFYLICDCNPDLFMRSAMPA